VVVLLLMVVPISKIDQIQYDFWEVFVPRKILVPKDIASKVCIW
jgi:hypothetical protein